MRSLSEPVVVPNSLSPAFYEVWGRSRYWERYEAVALAVGIEPIKPELMLAQLTQLHNAGTEEEKHFLRRINMIRHLVERHFVSPFEPNIPPSAFLTWLRDQDIWVPVGMAEAVKKYDRGSIDWKARAIQAEALAVELGERLENLEIPLLPLPEKPSLPTRNRESLLKLVIGMAIKGYAYEPDASRSSAPSEIASDLQQLGLSLTDDTIRKYLREGAELLPREPE